MSNIQSTMTPKEIVHELDRYIIGQAAAKDAVAIALRNRWRRMQLDEQLSQEISPKNILMIGPTGVGKTEIARRLAKLARAPFIKVEATKFTEVGYVGRDVDSIIRDLADMAIKMLREEALEKVHVRAKIMAVEKILTTLVKAEEAKKTPVVEEDKDPVVDEAEDNPEKALAVALAEDVKDTELPPLDTDPLWQQYHQQLLAGELDEQEIDIEVSASAVGVEIMAPPGMEEMTSQLQHMFQNLSSERRKTRKMKIKEALKQLCDDEAAKMINEDEIQEAAVRSVEQNGIVFLDELDKVVCSNERGGLDVSREGVQRDLLPLVEGCTVFTKYGMIKTDHVLFIASGAFHLSKPSDLIPELQGRLPIRVELNALTAADFTRILSEPQASLTEQYVALLATEGLELCFEQSGIERLAAVAYQVNERSENIGARRLHTVMEQLLRDVSFHAPDRSGETVMVDQTYVDKQLNGLVKDEDLSRYIL